MSQGPEPIASLEAKSKSTFSRPVSSKLDAWRTSETVTLTSGRASARCPPRQPERSRLSVTRLVRLLDADPELGSELAPAVHEQARRRLIAEVVELPPGAAVDEVLDDSRVHTALGLLVLEGIVVRRVKLVGRQGVELLGQGDLVRPWQFDWDVASVPATSQWDVCDDVRMAILDDDVQASLAHFPAVLRVLFARTERRANLLALNLTLAQLPRVDARLLVLFWHLADRFGRVERDGVVVVPLRLAHRTLADLVAAARPTVSSALRRLEQHGYLVYDHARQVWRLHGEPPAEASSLAALSTAGRPPAACA